MKVSVLKRLEALENVVRKSESPDLILVSYDDNVDKFVFDEDYFKRDSHGRVAMGGYRKTHLKKHYSDYVFAENVHANVIFMCFCNDFQIDIRFDTDDLRRSCGMSRDTAFYIESVSRSNEEELEIGVCAYKNERNG